MLWKIICPKHLNLAGADTVIQDELETTIVITSCLSSGGQILREDEDGQYIDKLSLWLSKSILPDGTIIPQDEMPEGQ